MKHPSSEDWMTLLYGEVTSEQKSKLTRHLSQCAICSAQVNQWRESMTALGAWPDDPVSCVARFRPFAKWAAAAALVVGVGFLAGRFSSPAGTGDIATAKESLRTEFQQQLADTRATLLAEFRRREQALVSAQNATAAEAEHLLAEYVRASDSRRTADLQTIYAAMKQLEAQRQTEHATLRKELETVAVATESSLVQLAGARLPEYPGQ
jgi:hypothetical protein